MSQASVEETEALSAPPTRVNFSDGNHLLHVQVLSEWLPPQLRHAPLIDWARLPSSTIAYLTNSVGDSPFRGHIALALICAAGALKANSLKTTAAQLNKVLQRIQQTCSIYHSTELTPQIWYALATDEGIPPDLYYGLRVYKQCTTKHLPDYLDQLTSQQRTQIQPYLLPPLPRRFWQEQTNGPAIEAAAKRRRKEKSDVLAPLHHLLVALVRLRKQAVERMHLAYQEAQKQVTSSHETLPLAFAYQEELVTINQNARTVSELCLEKRQATLSFLLWDRRTWVLSHPNDYSSTTINEAKKRLKEFAEQQFFLQFLGPIDDLFWFGPLIKYRVHQMKATALNPDEERHRTQLLQEMGLTNGLECRRPGLLTPRQDHANILAHAMTRSGALLFDSESIYRAVLYGAALTTLALTNGSRMTELLQVSADRFKMRTYEEKKRGSSMGEQRLIRLQLLLPKGKRTEEERKLFLISESAYALLREIAQLLRDAHHGHIPVVSPHAHNTKAEDLKPERYLFQWAATDDGKLGALSAVDVTALLRFLLFGLEFRTRQGEPFAVSVHLLRHVMASVARHEHEVPVEAVAYALHHTPRRARDGSLTVPSATEYYTEESEEKALLAMASFQTNLETWVTSLEVNLPDEQLFAQMDEDLRSVFERWHTLLETALGFCGNTNLCPRGYNRTLCIGCPYLVLDPRKRPVATHWRTVYAKHAEQLEEQGNAIDAHQYQLLVRDLDDHLASMDLLQASIEDGTRTPLFLRLPSAPYDEVMTDA
jgi:hypothetical protein